MAGIEVAGLVLGSLPLVISGLEHYNDGIRSIRTIRHAVREYEPLRMTLMGEHLSFRNTLQLLLRDAVDETTHRRLMHDVGGQTWREPAVELALRRRLRSSYASYIEYVSHMQKCLDTLKKRLEIDDHGKGPWNNAKAFKKVILRVGFALRKQEYLDQINDIRHCNEYLIRLTGQSEVLYSLTSEEPSGPDFKQIRTNAGSLYDCLSRALHVSCVTAHTASLCLSSIQEIGAREGKQAGVRVVLEHVGDVQGTEASWTVKETNITTVHSALLGLELKRAQESLTNGAADKVAKVKMQAEPLASISSTLTDRQHATKDEIQDLCRKLQTTHPPQTKSTIGFISCTSKQYCHCVSSPEHCLIQVDTAYSSLRSLEVILQGKADYRLSLADVHRVAYNVAVGILGLHGTPWVQESWTRSDVSVLIHDGRLVSQHPFVTKALREDSVDGHLGSHSFANRNRPLFTLGLLMIELCMRRSIESLYQRYHLGKDGMIDDLSSLQLAQKLLAQGTISDETSTQFGNIVYRCIHCDFGQATASLNNAQFHNAVYTQVVLELEKACQLFA